MTLTRRQWLRILGAGLFTSGSDIPLFAADAKPSPLRITKVTITPIALPDPPLLAASGCHGPYFLRNVVQIETDAGITGIGETKGGLERTKNLERVKRMVMGKNAFAVRSFAKQICDLSPAAYAGIELACLDACGKATGRRLCELLGGPVREEVEFAAYLFYRYAADHPKLINDSRIVDKRGGGDNALDDWGEVRTPEAMVKMAQRFRKKWGFRVMKLKAGVLKPEIELETMRGMQNVFDGKLPLRIDPNGRWKTATALRIGKELKSLNLEYYEDPVRGQEAMAKVRRETGLKMSTNSCVTRFHHVPDAVKLKPIDVVLGDHHWWGGILGFQELGRVCETFGWGLGQHSNNHGGVTMAAMIHVGAVIPQLTYASDTHYVWLPEGSDIIQGGNLKIVDGKMKVPAGKGVGVTIDADKLAKAHETYRKCGMRDRDDRNTMRRVIPNWERALF